MTTAIRDDMFTPDVIADPYAYYGRLRDEDPVHWNNTYALWVITRHDDVTWMTRHNELFSSAVFRNDPKPAYPAIDESDLGLYEYVRNYQADQFIQHDRPEHLDIRKIVHGNFTPRAMESWRPFVVNAVKELLDSAEEKGTMDVMRDLATPLPVLVIAQMMGVPAEDRPYVRQLAEKLLYIGRGEHDRMPILTDGMKGMVEYVSPLVDERIVRPGDDFIRWFIPAANRDPNVFADPERFDISRQPNPHVAFGNGVHHCLGATLARVEGQEVFKALAERFPDLEVATTELEYQPSVTFRSLKSLPVTWQ